jgi:hypothetical protein
MNEKALQELRANVCALEVLVVEALAMGLAARAAAAGDGALLPRVSGLARKVAVKAREIRDGDGKPLAPDFAALVDADFDRIFATLADRAAEIGTLLKPAPETK